MAVEPKYYFEDEHPDWREADDFTNLSKDEFSILRTQLEVISPIGKLVKSENTILVVTNMTGWQTEYFTNASVTWGLVVDFRKDDKPPYEVRWLRFKYGAYAEKPHEKKDIKIEFPSTSAPPKRTTKSK